MRIVIITQDEPFYLRSSLQEFLNLLPKKHQVVGCVVSTVSPFGKQESFLKKALQTLNVFGIRFFLYYSLKFVFSKLNSSNSLESFLKTNNIEKILLDKSINNKESIEIIKSYKPDL